MAHSFQDVGSGGTGGSGTGGGGGGEDKPVASIEGPVEILVGKSVLFTIQGNGGVPFAQPAAPYDFFACHQCVPLENEPHCAPGPIQVVGEPDVSNVRPYWVCASPIGKHVLRAMVSDSQVLNSDVVEKQFEVLPPDEIKPSPATYFADANIGPNGGLFGATLSFRIQRGGEQIGSCATACAEIKLWNLDEKEPRSYMGAGCDCSQSISPVCVQSPFVHVPFVYPIPAHEVQNWQNIPDGTVFYKAGFRVKLRMSECHGEEFTMESDMFKISIKKINDSRVKIEIK